METTERIVEAYVRYVKGWATIPNVRCGGQNEIDLIAIDPVSLDRYHIEVSVSISQGFRKLTAKPYDAQKAKERVHQASQRRTVGFFVEKKFGSQTVIDRLKEYGFCEGNYARVVVTWGWEEGALTQAENTGIELWDFREIINEVAEHIRGSREYFADDTLRTLNLFIHASDEAERSAKKAPTKQRKPIQPIAGLGSREGYWVYNNWVHDYATVHEASCAYCNDGRGTQGSTSTENSEWLGPFATTDEAWRAAKNTGRSDPRPCKACSPIISRPGA